MTLKFTSSSQTSLLSSRLPYTAAYPLCPLGVSHVLQTQLVQNSHFSLPERTVPSSMNLVNPDDWSHYWPTYLSFTVISSWPSFWLCLLNISLTIDFSLSALSPKLSPDSTVVWLITLCPLGASRTVLHCRQSALWRFIHPFIHWEIFIESLLCASCDQDRHVPDLLELY